MLSPIRLRRPHRHHRSHELESLARKEKPRATQVSLFGWETSDERPQHWQEWLPEKVKQLRAEDKFSEEVHAAAVMAQDEIEHLMKYQGYSIHEAREVALPLFILLPPEDPPDDDEQEAELREREREYQKNPPPESQM
jgi:hypothetical protein